MWLIKCGACGYSIVPIDLILARSRSSQGLGPGREQGLKGGVAVSISITLS